MQLTSRQANHRTHFQNVSPHRTRPHYDSTFPANRQQVYSLLGTFHFWGRVFAAPSPRLGGGLGVSPCIDVHRLLTRRTPPGPVCLADEAGHTGAASVFPQGETHPSPTGVLYLGASFASLQAPVLGAVVLHCEAPLITSWERPRDEGCEHLPQN